MPSTPSPCILNSPLQPPSKGAVTIYHLRRGVGVGGFRGTRGFQGGRGAGKVVADKV